MTSDNNISCSSTSSDETPPRKSSTKHHLGAAKKIMRYIAKTIDFGILYSHSKIYIVGVAAAVDASVVGSQWAFFEDGFGLERSRWGACGDSNLGLDHRCLVESGVNGSGLDWEDLGGGLVLKGHGGELAATATWVWMSPFLRQSAGYHSIPCNSSLCNSLDKLDLGASFSWVDCTQNNTSTTYHSIPCNSSLCNSLDKLDLGASFSWVDCTQNNTSTTYHSIPCNSSLCNSLDKLACSNCFDSPGLGCSNDSCALFPENSATRKVLLAQALVDTLALPLSDGRNPGRLGLVREFVIFCSKTPLLKGFPKGTTSLGRSNFSLPAQLSSIYSIPSVFALCLSGSPSASGVAFFAV
ncbi:hypothetical protein RJ640_007703 [Escallonia rubra]|uniref:Xylanase inhibitor N-terminal domain-containing protein n=1 Tax=Escallonia rubra TaxID=112253 RepID=A0AA88UKE4_9ASTE|nr:hypothetical protein RJ640_007703 [Escallonia rubra]